MVYRHYGSSVESKRDEIIRNYEAAGVSLDTAKNESGYDEVDTEVMAAFVEEKLLTDYDTILSTVKTDRTLGERILDWLNKVLTKITGTKEQRFLIEAREKWNRALKEEREENKKTPERTGETRKHSINKEEQKQEEAAFISEIEAWNQEGKPNRDTFVLGSTGEVLQGLGAIESDIYIKASKINTILKEHPEMTLAEIKKIPQILNDPIMILKSRNAGRAKQQNSRLVIFGSIKAQNGKPVLTVLDLKPIENHLVIDDMQKVTSAYTKTSNPVDFVRSSYILYVDSNKKRAASLLSSIGFQMPIEVQRVGSIGSISYIRDSVNVSGEPFSKIVKKSTVRYSVGTAEDTAYLEAVERGDMETAQRMVDEAAKKAGYTVRLYHQTDADFTVFEPRHEGAGSRDNETPYGIFMKTSSGNIGLRGEKKMALYAKIQNPLVADNRSVLRETLKEMSSEYRDLQNEIKDIDKIYGEKFEVAKNEWKDYIIKWRKEHPEEKQSVLYDDPEFQRLFDLEDSITDEWTEAAASLDKRAKDEITRTLVQNGYDGVVLRQDVGSFGRSTDAYVALDPNQVKSADPVVYDDNGGVIPLSERFKEDNDDIRYSIGYTEDNEPFVEVTGDVLNGVSKKDIPAVLNQIVEEKFNELVEANGQKIGINKKTAREWQFSKYADKLRHTHKTVYKDKLRAFDNADELLIASKDYIGEKSKHGNYKEYARGIVNFRVKGRGYQADILVGIDNSNNAFLYDIVNIKTKKIEASNTTLAGNPADRRKMDASDRNISNSPSNVKKKFSVGTSDLKVDKETRDLITAHNAAMREVFYSRSRADQTELWDKIKEEMAHILRTGAAQRKAVDEIVQLAYDTGYRIARRENEAVNTWGKGILHPRKIHGRNGLSRRLKGRE